MANVLATATLEAVTFRLIPANLFQKVFITVYVLSEKTSTAIILMLHILLFLVYWAVLFVNRLMIGELYIWQDDSQNDLDRTVNTWSPVVTGNCSHVHVKFSLEQKNKNK